jgi:hypothetical protein
MRCVEGRWLEEEGVLEVTGGSEFGRRSLQMSGGSASNSSSLEAQSQAKKERGEGECWGFYSV